MKRKQESKNQDTWNELRKYVIMKALGFKANRPLAIDFIHGDISVALSVFPTDQHIWSWRLQKDYKGFPIQSIRCLANGEIRYNDDYYKIDEINKLVAEGHGRVRR